MPILDERKAVTTRLRLRFLEVKRDFVYKDVLQPEIGALLEVLIDQELRIEGLQKDRDDLCRVLRDVVRATRFGAIEDTGARDLLRRIDAVQYDPREPEADSQSEGERGTDAGL